MWWIQAGGLVVALLGVAASANWLVRRPTRRLHRMRIEAELLAVLPEGEAKTRLVERVQSDVLLHVFEMENADLLRMRAIYRGLVIVFGVVAVIVGGGAMLLGEGLHRIDDSAVNVTLGVVLTFGVLSAVFGERLRARAMRIYDERNTPG